MVGRKRASLKFNGFDSKNVIFLYKLRYENSALIPIISKIHEEAFGEIQITYKDHEFGNEISSGEKATLINFSGNHIDIDTSVTVKSLHGFLEDYVLQSPAYIDFWATWCISCLAEFGRASTTKGLMDENGIKMVYISLDKPENKNSWLNLIKLQGIHVLAREMLTKELTENHKVTAIPRYMIIDKNGNFTIRNAPRPSVLRDLIEEINKL